jgi:predicted nucleic acid-binding protein
MSLTIFLDSGPLVLLTNTNRTPDIVACLQWAVDMMAAGHRFVVPSIADYEVRRELQRAGKLGGLASLDAWNTAYPDRYLPLSDSALRLGSMLWAQARNAGTPTADPKELDGDVLISAQALDTGLPKSDFIVATVNVGHMALFVPAKEWTSIFP